LVSKKDLDFLSREYECLDNIPKEKKYLLKYFRKEIQKHFLQYYFVFGNYDNFVDHTGFYCQTKWLKILHKKLIDLEELYSNAKKNMDLDLLGKIEARKYRYKV